MNKARNPNRSAAAVSWLALCCPVVAAAAADYPDKPVRLIIPFAPGGPTDILGRAIAQKMSERLKQPVIVENRTGAGGAVGITAVARASPDGYVLGYGSASTLAINGSIYKLDYDPQRDLAPIGLVGVGAYTIIAHPSLPADLRGFIAHVRSRPGKVNMGSSGIGSSPHVAGALFNDAAGLDVVHVPFKGASQGLPAVAGGDVQYMFDSPGTSKAFAAAGRINILAVTSLERSELLPDVPTVSEAAIPGFNATTWSGLVAPAGTPPAVLAKLSRALQEVLTLADVRETLRVNGYAPQDTSPEKFARFIDDEIRKWSAIIQKAKITGE